MLPLRFFGVLAIAAATIHAAPAIFPLKDIRAGQHGVGRTVFSGSRVEEFDVEILGVLENMSPKESIILGRLKGGPLEHTGVMQGMSGSPVYIDGKLVSEKKDSTKNTLTIPILPGEGVRVVSILIEASTVGERAGLGGTVTLE